MPCPCEAGKCGCKEDCLKSGQCSCDTNCTHCHQSSQGCGKEGCKCEDCKCPQGTALHHGWKRTCGSRDNL
ncbi:unnamed protein product [Adineta ricciae]|nr:unnamed protein product [Adineta ricciae]